MTSPSTARLEALALVRAAERHDDVTGNAVFHGSDDQSTLVGCLAHLTRHVVAAWVGADHVEDALDLLRDYEIATEAR